ncbi:uncharacterized protein METZ01_LOCUS212565, partial [marine metagenome]
LLNLRRKLAEILGHRDFADYILEDRMAKKGEIACEFVDDLTRETKPYWIRDIAHLR